MNMKVLPPNKKDRKKIWLTCYYCKQKFKRWPSQAKAIRPRCGKECPARITVRSCRLCGGPFQTYVGSNRRVCKKNCNPFVRSEQWEYGSAQQRLTKKRKAIYAQGDDIDRFEVFERDGWQCGLCGEPVDKYRRFPDPFAATLDHVIPLCLGGEHTYENVQCSHSYCNSLKGGMLLEG